MSKKPFYFGASSDEPRTSDLTVEYCEKLGTRLVKIDARYVRELVKNHLEAKALGLERDFALKIWCDSKNALCTEVDSEGFEVTVHE